MGISPSPSQDPSDDAFQHYKQRITEHRAKMQERPVPTRQISTRLSWTSSLVIGACTGLVFGLASQGFNQLLLPGVPLALAPFGTAGNILLYLILGTLIGLFSNLNTRAQGIILAVLVGADFLLFLRGALTGPDITLQKTMDYLFASFFILGATFLAIFLIIPIGFFIRWAVNTQCENFYRPWWSWQRISVPAALMLLAGITGTLFLYSPAERNAVAQMDKIIQMGIAAKSEDELPPALKGMIGAKFWKYAHGPYGIRSERRVSANRKIDGLMGNYSSFDVTTIFQNGYTFTCRAIGEGGIVDCLSDYDPPLYKQNAFATGTHSASVIH